MSAVTVDMNLEAGADYDLALTWKDSSLALVNLTGYTAAAQGRAYYGASATLFSLTHASGITLGGVAGTILVHLTAAATGALGTGTIGVWDLELTSGGGAVTRLVQGVVTNSPQVTA